MPHADKSGFGKTARGISAAGDCLRVTYNLARGGKLRGIVVTARANTAAPTAAQQQGIARVIAYLGIDKSINPGPNATQSDAAQAGELLCDHDVGMVYGSGDPTHIPMSFNVPPGESVTVEVSVVQDNAGAQTGNLAAVTLLGDEPESVTRVTQ